MLDNSNSLPKALGNNMERLYLLIGEFLDSATVNIFFEADPKRQFLLDKDASDNQERLALAINRCVLGVGMATIQLLSVVQNLEISVKMLKRFPWHGTDITKSQHLELVWFQVQNLCYQFSEKTKLLYNQEKRACEMLGLNLDKWFKIEKGKIDKCLGKAIQDRGNTIHSFNPKNSSLDYFGSVELLNNLDADGFNSEYLRDSYFEAKRNLASAAKGYLVFQTETMLRIMTEYETSPTKITKRWNEVVEGINEGKIKLHEKTG